MPLPTPLAKMMTCRSGQRWVLRSFIGENVAKSSAAGLMRRQPFSSTPNRPRETAEQLPGEDHALNEINDEVSQAPDPVSKLAQDAHVPWYLQVQQPMRQPESPLAARQTIPHLPEHPPSLIEPLLNHVSVELGMDDLALLDLRSLDPPPALGANLIMLIGTARSEKHLHVSADRLCRWLRTEYKLSPYADGLLGRNELKLKLRRKAKQTRLLSAVGAKATANTELDDGIRTGWVCVNIGRVPGGELPVDEEKRQQESSIVGFSAQTVGSNVVVQLLTEEKRSEIDLEKLWTDMLERALREEGRLDQHEANTAEGSPPTLERHETLARPPSEEPRSASFYHSTVNSTHQDRQLRAYHTSVRSMLATVNSRSAWTTKS